MFPTLNVNDPLDASDKSDWPPAGEDNNVTTKFPGMGVVLGPAGFVLELVSLVMTRPETGSEVRTKYVSFLAIGPSDDAKIPIVTVASEHVTWQRRYEKVTVSRELKAGTNRNVPSLLSVRFPDAGPVNKVTIYVPGVGGIAPLQPISLVVTELRRTEFSKI